MAHFTPTNQKRLTNVSVVRLKKGGIRFELACYPNKVRAWRDRLETNLNEVLQTHSVFTNVSKGQFANKKEMFQIFQTEDETHIIKLILEQGELQLTEKERQFEMNNTFRDVAKIISERCVNPENNRPYTVTMIEKMMKDCHISLKANKSAKQHALEVIKELRAAEGFKIAPAMMELAISIDRGAYDEVKDDLSALCVNFLRQGFTENGNFDLAVAVEPEKYGAIEALLHKKIKGRYCIEIIGSARHGSNKLRTGDPPASTSWNPSSEHSEKSTQKAASAAQVNVDDTSSQASSSVDKRPKKKGKGRKPQGSDVDDTKEQKIEAPVDNINVKAPAAEKVSKSKKQKHARKKAARDDWPDDDD